MISRKAVISQVQTNSGICNRRMPGARMFRMVAITLIEPMIEEMPIMWMANTTKAKLWPPCRLSGGYSVQPAAGPPESMNSVLSNIAKANGRIQKLQLFMRGSAMSGAPIIIGIIQLAKPTQAGITAPNTMISACMVVIWLKKSGSTSCRPGMNSSARMIMAMAPPVKNISSANTRYSVPMSLWLVVNSQRFRKPVGLWSWCSACDCVSWL